MQASLLWGLGLSSILKNAGFHRSKTPTVVIAMLSEGNAASPRAAGVTEIMGGPDQPGHDDREGGDKQRKRRLHRCSRPDPVSRNPRRA
jgi:hypothetical protein